MEDPDLSSESGSDSESGDELGEMATHARSLSQSQMSRRESLMATKGLIDKVLMPRGKSRSDALDDSEGDSSDGDGAGGGVIMTAEEEMAMFIDMKDKAMANWDLIDTSGNGDVDEEEWTQGLINLDVGVTEAEARRLFGLVDREDSEFVEKQDWFTIVMVPFSNEFLVKVQRKLQMKCGAGYGYGGIGGTQHKRKRSLVDDEDASISDDEMGNLAAEMKREMMKQATELVKSVEKEQSFLEDLEMEAKKREDFADPSRALEWSNKEVAIFIDNCGHSGTYAKAIVEKGIDGKTLLNDVSQVILSTEVGVSQLHMGAILRSIDELRKQHKVSLTNPYKDWTILEEENKKLLETIEGLQAQVRELDVQRGELLLKMSEVEGGGMYAGLIAPVSSTGLVSEPTVPLSEYERVCREKVDLTKSLASELQSLRYALKVYQSDAAASSGSRLTPEGGFHPIDSLVSMMGYQPAG